MKRARETEVIGMQYLGLVCCQWNRFTTLFRHEEFAKNKCR